MCVFLLKCTCIPLCVCVSLVGLEGSITAFRASHNAGPFETRGSRKLLILLPLNANITHTLEDEDTNIHFHDNLPDTEIDRAGVRGRVYKHSVYSLLDENRQGGRDYLTVSHLLKHYPKVKCITLAPPCGQIVNQQ